MMKKAICTGQSGFLLRNSIPYLYNHNIEFIDYESGAIYRDVSLVAHFGGPSDIYDFIDAKRMAHSMVDITVELVKLYG